MQAKFFKVFILLAAVTIVFTSSVISQTVSISNQPVSADTSAILDISSQGKGLLIPRMSLQQKNMISNPATGLLIYQVDGDAGFYYYNGIKWYLLVNSALADRQKTLLYTVKGF